MTAQSETIANLVGKLGFQVDTTGLQRFTQQMRQAARQMNALGQSYSKMAQQMTKGLQLKIDASAAIKAKAKLQQAMDRELKAETALQSAKRSTFQSEISQQKLVYSGTKQQATLVTALVKDQQQAAVIAAKAHNAQQQANGITRQQVASQSQLVALQAKQARLQQIHSKTQAITSKADANHLLTQTKAQQIQTVTARIVAQQQHQAIQHQARMASLAAAANAKQTAANNAQTKFQWQSQKHAVWQANQAARAAKAASASSGGGFIGGMAGMLRGGVGGIGAEIVTALGPVGMALAAAAAGVSLAVSKMNERIEARQANVIEAQGFDNTFMSISKNQEIAKSFRDAFIKTQNENGGVVDTDTAKDFRTLAINMAAAGKTKDQIISTWDTRQKAFSVAGTTKEDNRELNKQLGQMASDGTGAASDANIINDRMPMLTPYVVREYMKDNNITDYNKGLGSYNKDLKGGKGVKFSWYDEGMKKLVAENAESLERNRNSVASNQQRAVTQTYLQANGINSSPELAAAMNDNIKAHQELTAAMKPVNEALGEFDTWLTKLSAGFILMMLGKDEEGNEKPRFKLGMKHRYKDEEPDYLKAISGWLGLDDKESNSETLEGFNPKSVIQMDGFQQMAQLYQQYESPSFPAIAADNTKNIGGTQINAPVTVEGSNIHIELHGSATDEDRAKIMDAVTTKLDERTSALTLQMPALADDAVRNAFGAVRAQQAERR